MIALVWIDKSMETESRFLVARGSEQGSRGEWLLIGVGFLSGMKCSRIRLVIVVQLYDYANKHWIVHIKMVNFMACKLYLLRVPWTARRSNQSILKEISPEYSLEGLMLKLRLQYFGHLMRKKWLNGKDPDSGKDWRQEDRGQQRMT